MKPPNARSSQRSNRGLLHARQSPTTCPSSRCQALTIDDRVEGFHEQLGFVRIAHPPSCRERSSGGRRPRHDAPRARD
eukprot:4954164-Pyramimonas_sp.AAC.1